jgi:hypothetical protein
MTDCYIVQSIIKLLDYNPNALAVKHLYHTASYTVVKFMNDSKYLILYCSNQKPRITKHELKVAKKCSGVCYVLKEHNSDLKYLLTNYDILKKEIDNHIKKIQYFFFFKFKFYFYFTRLINAGIYL